MLDDTASYIDKLKNETSVLENYVQGELWKKQLGKIDGIVLSETIYSDDVELRNALGGHAGKN